MTVANNFAEVFFLMTVRASGWIVQAGFVEDGWPEDLKKQEDLNFSCDIQTYVKKFLSQVFVVTKATWRLHHSSISKQIPSVFIPLIAVPVSLSFV